MTENHIDKKKEKIFKGIMIGFNVFIVLILMFLAESYYKNKYSAIADSLKNWDEKPVVFFRFDEELGWTGVPNIDSYHNSDAWITHNSMGFRDPEWDFSGTKPSILVLGDSNMWGYGVESNETTVAILRKLMPQYDWYNGGMNGYSTDQHDLLYKRLADVINPDLTIVVFAQNDRYENKHKRVRGYDKPYSEVIDGKAVVQNVPIAKTVEDRSHNEVPKAVKMYQKTHSFLCYHIAQKFDAKESRQESITANQKVDPSPYIVKRLYERSGHKLLVVTILRDQYMYDYCKSNNIPVAMFADDVAIPGLLTYPKGPPKHGHWKPEGFRRAAEEIQKAMIANDLPQKDMNE
ncbi:MAG: SGNH/GDSL hydrolase family protein [Kiritimatiellae bacterium]|jgi:hypothetical protein|nr:SGNH/GDSL hydrolase family protein [Kiritimatiellia bacterium]